MSSAALSSSSSRTNLAEQQQRGEEADGNTTTITTDDCFALYQAAAERSDQYLASEERSLRRRAKFWIVGGAVSMVGFAYCQNFFSSSTNRVYRIRNPTTVKHLFWARFGFASMLASSFFLLVSPYPVGYPAVVEECRKRSAAVDAIGMGALALAERVRLSHYNRDHSNDALPPSLPSSSPSSSSPNSDLLAGGVGGAAAFSPSLPLDNESDRRLFEALRQRLIRFKRAAEAMDKDVI